MDNLKYNNYIGGEEDEDGSAEQDTDQSEWGLVPYRDKPGDHPSVVQGEETLCDEGGPEL